MKDAKVCRVSFHRPNLAFDVRKVAGEADKLRQLGKLIQRLRRPGIVYCATVRAVDELYVALRHGKIPVERYNGKMTTDEREKSQASFMQPGRKVVMLATNAFGLGIDKPDIRYIIHYQMPGSPEAYVQEAGRAGRDGKPARCVLLFQPDDIAIQEHFLKEAHPTKTQARMVAEGLYAWSDEGKEVSVRDLALSMALPERRVRVILSVLEAMGVAEEVKAARWKGVEPKPTREQIDKAASVFEARRISDRRRLESLLKYMNTQKLPRADAARLLRRARGREVRAVRFGRGPRQRGVRSRRSADERHGLHAATDFHARPRRRRRGTRRPATRRRCQRRRACAGDATAAACSRRRSRATCCRRCRRSRFRRRAESEQTFDEGLWAARGRGRGRADVRRRGRRSWPIHAAMAAGGSTQPRRRTAPAPAGDRGLHHRLGGGARRQHPAVRRVAARRAGRAAGARGAARSGERRQQRRPPRTWPRPRPWRRSRRWRRRRRWRRIGIAAAVGPAADSTVARRGRRPAAKAARQEPRSRRNRSNNGAIIIATATAIAGHACPAFTIQAATSVPALPGGD